MKRACGEIGLSTTVHGCNHPTQVVVPQMRRQILTHRTGLVFSFSLNSGRWILGCTILGCNIIGLRFCLLLLASFYVRGLDRSIHWVAAVALGMQPPWGLAAPSIHTLSFFILVAQITTNFALRVVSAFFRWSTFVSGENGKEMEIQRGLPYVRLSHQFFLILQHLPVTVTTSCQVNAVQCRECLVFPQNEFMISKATNSTDGHVLTLL